MIHFIYTNVKKQEKTDNKAFSLANYLPTESRHWSYIALFAKKLYAVKQKIQKIEEPDNVKASIAELS